MRCQPHWPKDEKPELRSGIPLASMSHRAEESVVLMWSKMAADIRIHVRLRVVCYNKYIQMLVY